MRIQTYLLALLALMAAAPLASAQVVCPECDPDGAPDPDASYGSVDVGAVVNDTGGALADSDVSFSDSDHKNGFFTWISICFTAWLDAFGELLGFESVASGGAEAYVSDDGADLDASLSCPAGVPVAECAWDFDESELGGLDGATWETMDSLPVDPELSGVGDAIPYYEVDGCVYAELSVATCG